jgi:16S rRNA (uracil1498-N3)-methyltransferase
MHRFHLPSGECQQEMLILRDHEARHALQVLRLRPGDPVAVLDGEGTRLHCEVRRTARHVVELGVTQREFVAPLPYRVTLAQALPKGKTFDTIMQKATELGAWRVVPLVSERVLSRPDDAQAPAKVEHWRRIAIESIKQCGSPWLPKIEPPLSLTGFLARKEPVDLALIASLLEDRQFPRARFEAFQARHGRRPQNVCIWIGPEGDFTPGEYRAIQDAGALPITLGPLVLRADTAAICCLAVVSCELQAGFAGADR